MFFCGTCLIEGGSYCRMAQTHSSGQDILKYTSLTLPHQKGVESTTIWLVSYISATCQLFIISGNLGEKADFGIENCFTMNKISEHILLWPSWRSRKLYRTVGLLVYKHATGYYRLILLLWWLMISTGVCQPEFANILYMIKKNATWRWQWALPVTAIVYCLNEKQSWRGKKYCCKLESFYSSISQILLGGIKNNSPRWLEEIFSECSLQFLRIHPNTLYMVVQFQIPSYNTFLEWF